jgi:hypothetical protein
MALLNKVWRESRYVPEGAEPGLYTGRSFQENVQNKAVQDIARTRFAYPSVDEPGLKTYTNRPDHTIGVRTPSGDLLFPDIVVLDAATTEVRLLGEVETANSLRKADVIDKWRAFASTGKLLLFVPLSEVDRTRQLLRSFELPIAGLRGWKHNMGQQIVEVYDLPV